MSRADVEFEGHGGTTLRGWLYLPDPTARPAAGIVMAHGLSAVKEMVLDRYAEVFCQAGMAVLAYDHRNLGASDGEPRQEINPGAQARDYRRAIDWLAGRPELDAERIGLWGSSYSGGEVIVVGACDERVRAVVATEDRLTDTAVSVEGFERAGDPKELIMLEGHHFAPYAGEPFERASQAARLGHRWCASPVASSRSTTWHSGSTPRADSTPAPSRPSCASARSH